MGTGEPVLASRTGGIPEIVDDGNSGVLLPEDAGGKDYAEAITSTIGEPDLVDRMSRSGYQRFQDRLNWSTWADRTLEIMKSL